MSAVHVHEAHVRDTHVRETHVRDALCESERLKTTFRQVPRTNNKNVENVQELPRTYDNVRVNNVNNVAVSSERRPRVAASQLQNNLTVVDKHHKHHKHHNARLLIN